jgi:uncharacterized protein (TIGR00290 family)
MSLRAGPDKGAKTNGGGRRGRPLSLLSWSGGKDSALTLHENRRSGSYDVVALLTTVTRDFDRVSMHGVRRTLLEMQGEAVGLPIEKVWISKNASNEEYESQMKAVLEKYKLTGVRDVLFGDLFLQEIRRYREERLTGIGMNAVFPIWKRETGALARRFVEDGFRAIVCCIDPKSLDKKFCGMEFDEAFLSRLPPRVDPCGENGEFHTFVYDGPVFRNSIEVTVGEVVLRDGFYFADILPVD